MIEIGYARATREYVATTALHPTLVGRASSRLGAAMMLAAVLSEALAAALAALALRRKES